MKNPRTSKERKAYVSGYLDAVLYVSREGFEAARKWALEMASLEETLTQPEETDE